MGLRFVSYVYSIRDVPGCFSLVLFLPYCNFKCKHCHNWRIVSGEEEALLDEEEILHEVRGNPFLECVVISGGEPTVWGIKLKRFIERIRESNPRVKIRVDTNGYLPDVLESIRSIVDGFAVDIKSPLDDGKLYSYIVGIKVDVERIRRSIQISDGMPLTIYRTPKYTWLKEEDIARIREFTDKLDSPWYLNEFLEVPDCPFNV